MSVYEKINKQFASYENYHDHIADNLSWLKARKLHTEEGYQEYLSQFLQGRFISVAKQYIQNFRQESVVESRQKELGVQQKIQKENEKKYKLFMEIKPKIEFQSKFNSYQAKITLFLCCLLFITTIVYRNKHENLLFVIPFAIFISLIIGSIVSTIAFMALEKLLITLEFNFIEDNDNCDKSFPDASIEELSNNKKRYRIKIYRSAVNNNYTKIKKYPLWKLKPEIVYVNFVEIYNLYKIEKP